MIFLKKDSLKEKQNDLQRQPKRKIKLNIEESDSDENIITPRTNGICITRRNSYEIDVDFNVNKKNDDAKSYNLRNTLNESSSKPTLKLPIRTLKGKQEPEGSSKFTFYFF